jgi:predicted dehydrogenase
MPGAELVAVVDANLERARAIAGQYGGEPHADTSALPALDAVVIAAPTTVHSVLALPYLRAGVAVLVEKPMTTTLEEADALVETADRSGAVLAVGHTERFNPAVFAARPLLDAPKFIEIHRIGVFPDRSLDIDVVFDLMIHDLDLLLAVVGSEVAAVEAVGVNVLTPRTDIANARIRFASGCVANVTASRISRDRIRKARFFQRDAYISIDFAEQELEMYRLVRDGGRPSIQGGKLEVTREEPLRRELEDFLGAVREQRAPTVTGRDGRAALALATRVAQTMETHERSSLA